MSVKKGAESGGFPDFHHKMSKKIAQLTKVIYALNTKNDDHEYQLKSLSDTYESEIEEILQDTSKKINHFKEMLENKNNEAKITQAIKTLSQQHTKEKQKALEEFELFKKQCKQREAQIQTESEHQLKHLTQELNTIKSEFQTRLNQFAKISQQLDQQHSQNSDAIRKAHQDELDELVKNSNQKYNEMLTKMLNEQDDLREKLEAEFKTRLTKALKDEEDKWRALLQEESEKRKKALELQRSEFEKLQQGSSSDMNVKFSKMTSEIDRLKEIETMLNLRLSKQIVEINEKEDVISKYKKKIEDLEAGLEHSEKNRASMENLLRSQVTASETAHEQTKSELQTALEEIKRLKVSKIYIQIYNVVSNYKFWRI